MQRKLFYFGFRDFDFGFKKNAEAGISNAEWKR